MNKIEFDNPIHIQEALRLYDQRNVEFLTTPELYPMIKGISFLCNPKHVIKTNGKLKNSDIKGFYKNLLDIYKLDQDGVWLQLDEEDYVFIPSGADDEAKARILLRHIGNIHYVNAKSDGDVPQIVRKRIARIATRHNLDLSIIDRFMLKQNSQVHSAYNIELNAIRVVPGYFIRLGMIRIGDEFIDEFEKTFIHEYGHVIWHRLLDKKKRKRYEKLIPRFYTKDEIEDSPDRYMRGRINTLHGQVVYSKLYTLMLDKFVSDYARYSLKEDFAESFCYFKIAPELVDDNRRKFLEKLTVGDVIEKDLKVDVDGDPVSISRYTPVDFQVNDHRRQLAAEFEQDLKNTLSEMKRDISDINNIVIYGEYSTVQEVPEDIKAVVVLRNITNRVEAVQGNTKIWFVPSQEEADSLIYEFKNIGEKNMKLVEKRKKRKKKTKHRWYDPEQVEAYYRTKEGALIPSPKGEGKSLPKGHAEKGITTKVLALDNPMETVYSLQHHFTEKAPTHYDLRIKIGKKAYSWALPKGLPTPKNPKRLAVPQPVHKTEYMKFSGKIKTKYGRGTVNLTDYRGVDVRSWTKKRKEFVVYSGPHRGRYILKPIGKKKNLIIRATHYRTPIKEQYDVALAKLKPRNSHFTDDNFVLQPKMDGARYLLYLSDKGNRLLSRQISVQSIKKVRDVGGYHVERTDNVPHIRDIKFRTEDTVLDGEIFRVDNEVTTSIMNSNPIRARELQRKRGLMRYYVFDVLRYKGQDVRKLPYATRFRLLKEAVKGAKGSGSKYIEIAPSFVKDKKKTYKELIRQGWEGVVLKDKRGQYTDRFMTKFKKVKEGDFGIVGYTKGKGKYEGLVGALKIARNVRGKVVAVGKVGTGRINMRQRRELTNKIDSMIKDKTIVQVNYMTRTKSGKLRAPVLIRVRHDKTWSDLNEKSK